MPCGYVVACGGGIIDTPDTRDILIEYYISGGIVLNVHRVLKYLQIDKTRPAYEEDMMEVYMRRQGWHVCQASKNDLARLAAEFAHFLDQRLSCSPEV